MTTGTGAGTSSDATTDRFDLDPAFICTTDFEINLAELTPDVKGDLESHKVPNLVAHDNPQK
jgi:hypothetical protein